MPIKKPLQIFKIAIPLLMMKEEYLFLSAPVMSNNFRMKRPAMRRLLILRATDRDEDTSFFG